MTKQCSVCGEVRPVEKFSKKQSKCHDCYAAYFRDYRAQNRQRTNDDTYRYIKSEKGRITQDRYHKSDTGKTRHRINELRRRGIKNGNGVFVISEKDMRQLLSQSCVECCGCGEHMDHIIPLSRGGRHSIGNLQMLCAPCNRSKHNKLSVEWRAHKARVAA